MLDKNKVKKINSDVIKRYTKRLKKLGFTKEALGWSKGKQDIRYKNLIKNIPSSIKTIVDVGCGLGDGIEIIDDQFDQVEYIGIDIVEDFTNFCRNKYPRKKFFNIDFKNLELDFKVDAVLASGIFNFNTGFNLKEINIFLEFCKMNKVRYVAFDVLSTNTTHRFDSNYYCAIEDLLPLINSYTRRFVLDHSSQPFEYSIFCDFNDAYEPSTSRYKNEIS
jgi:hypothetical protein